MMLKFASLTYPDSVGNLGDTIQTLAAERFLPQVDRHLDRDALHAVAGPDKYLIICNGWFTTHPENWPPSAAIAPVFWGLHLVNTPRVRQAMSRPESLAYFKRHEPIGCRDMETAQWLTHKGIRTVYSRCVTLTLPRRSTEGHQPDKVFLVDCDPNEIPLPGCLEQGAIEVTHSISSIYPDAIRRRLANYLLEVYRQQARLVITTRLHCALPCIAMGIPVIFVGNPREGRVSVLRELGCEFHPLPNVLRRYVYKALRQLPWRLKHHPRLQKVAGAVSEWGRRRLINRRVNWNPPALDIEDEKARLSAALRCRIQEVMATVSATEQETKSCA